MKLRKRPGKRKVDPNASNLTQAQQDKIMHNPFFYKKLVILRGLPGHGKSSLARFIQESAGSLSVVVCSADHFFEDDEGNYKFNPAQIGTAHMLCQKNARLAMESSILTVIVDNTNVKRRDFHIYAELAKKLGYGVIELTVGNLNIDDAMERNSHNVPRPAIEKMAQSLADSFEVESNED